MKNFEESDRFNYPDMTPDSVVVDIGGFEGNFANIIHQKYGCTVHIYEPVPKFFIQLEKRFADPKIHLHCFAIGGKEGSETFGVKGDMSGLMCSSPNEFIQVKVQDAAGALRFPIDLLKINAEGSEYAILDRLIEAQKLPYIRHISVQFHTVVPDYERRRQRIYDEMERAGFELCYDAPYVWTGWSRKNERGDEPQPETLSSQSAGHGPVGLLVLATG